MARKSKTKNSNNNVTVKKQPLVIKSLSKKVNVIVTDRFYNQVKYLCNKISDVEWSGVLLYSTKGDISDIDKFSITLEYIYLMDKGTGGATSYELGTDFVAFRMKHKESLKWKMGHIHSHNKMQAFFSGTDNEELSDNAENYNYYLSVVTNNALDFVGKLVFIGEVSNGPKYKCKSSTGEDYTLELKESEKVLFQRECKFKLPKTVDIDDEFKSRVNEIIEKSKTSVKVTTTTGYPSYGWGSSTFHKDPMTGGLVGNESLSVTAPSANEVATFLEDLSFRYANAVEFLGYWLSDNGILNYNMTRIVNDFDIKLKATHWVKSKLESIKSNYIMYARMNNIVPVTIDGFADMMDDLSDLIDEIEDLYPEFAKLFNEYYEKFVDNYSKNKENLLI